MRDASSWFSARFARIGGRAVGVVAITLQLAAKLVFLSLLAQRGGAWALPAIACISRIGPLVWTLTLPSLHAGMGSRFAGAIRWRHVAPWCAIGVPGGLDVTRSLRAQGWRRPIVVVTADGFEDTRTACLDAGADGFLLKPVRMDTLAPLLQRLMGLEWVYEQPRTATQPAAAA